MYYFEARYYDSEIGRFASVDPAGRLSPSSFLNDPQQMNAYSYVANNPLGFVDPTGTIRKNKEGSTRQERKAFRQALKEAKQEVKQNTELQEYFSDRYDVDIVEVLTDKKEGPVVNIAGEPGDYLAGYNPVTDEIQMGELGYYFEELIDSTLIHELEHWASDQAGYPDVLQEDSFNGYEENIDRIDAYAEQNNFSDVIESHGYTGYISEEIYCSECFTNQD